MPQDLRQFLSRFGVSLMTLARDGKPVRLKDKLQEYEQLFDTWLEIAPEGVVAQRPFSFADQQPTFRGPLEIDLYELIRAGAASGDSETGMTLAESTARLLVHSREQNQANVYHELTRVLGFSYYSGVCNAKVRAAIGGKFDRLLHSILFQFKSRHRALDRHGDAEAKAVFEREQPFLDHALALVLTLISYAMEEGDAKYAEYFFDRLVEHTEFERPHERLRAGSPTHETEKTLHDYAVVTIAAWALHLLEESHKDSEQAARAVLAKALSHLGNRCELVALWELYHSGSGFEAEVDHRLGTYRWDLRDKGEIRVGLGQVRSGGGEWKLRGFRAALLRADELDASLAERYFVEPPPRYMWDASKDEDRLKAIAAVPYVGLEESDRESAVADVVALLRRREEAANGAYHERAANEPLDADRCDRLRGNVTRGLQDHRHWIRAMLRLGVAADVEHVRTPDAQHLTRFLSRDYLIEDNNWPGGLGESIGEETARWEAIRLIALLEESAQQFAAVAALAELPEQVRDARRELINRGLTPNVLIIPNQARFASAIFAQPLWQVEGRGEFGPIGYGQWEGLHVLQFPYTDPKSVMILDTTKLFVAVADLNGAEIGIRELTADEVAKLQQEKGEKGTEPRVAVGVQVAAPLGVITRERDDLTETAVSLNIEDSDGAYAMVPGEATYHRPSCSEIEHEDDIRLSLIARLPDEDQDRQPCEVCRPQLDCEG